MLKKIATAAILAGALAFSAAAPAVLSAGSVADNSGVSVAVGNWPDPASAKVKKDKQADTTVSMYVGNWPDPG
jgi:hypothetical protein